MHTPARGDGRRLPCDAGEAPGPRRWRLRGHAAPPASSSPSRPMPIRPALRDLARQAGTTDSSSAIATCSSISVPPRNPDSRSNLVNGGTEKVTSIMQAWLEGTNGEQCDTSSIQVQTINMGTKVSGGDTVFEVQVTNQCPCAVRNVRLNGGGFTTTVEVDPAVFRSDDGDIYLVNGGEPIASMATVSFQYAWDHFFQMTPRSLEVDGQC
ncbi:hypothetical protein EJB05_27845, partial [Eragrostis curvula]